MFYGLRVCVIGVRCVWLCGFDVFGVCVVVCDCVVVDLWACLCVGFYVSALRVLVCVCLCGRASVGLYVVAHLCVSVYL